MDADIVQAVIEGDRRRAVAIAEQKCPGIYTDGWDHLQVTWVPKGASFHIEECEGSETIHIIGTHAYFIA